VLLDIDQRLRTPSYQVPSMSSIESQAMHLIGTVSLLVVLLLSFLQFLICIFAVFSVATTDARVILELVWWWGIHWRTILLDWCGLDVDFLVIGTI